MVDLIIHKAAVLKNDYKKDSFKKTYRIDKFIRNFNNNIDLDVYFSLCS